jgi:hypothetical protein
LETLMPPIISIKALILSNIALWIFLGLGMVLVIMIYYGGAAIASGGTSSAAAIFDQMKSSPMLIDALASVGVLAPIPAGYIAAKIAPRAKLLNGALSTSASIIFSLYVDIWGTNSDIYTPHWLDLLVSYGAPIPALVGAYIWQIRDSRHSLALVQAGSSAEMEQQREMLATSAGSKQIPLREQVILAALAVLIAGLVLYFLDRQFRLWLLIGPALGSIWWLCSSVVRSTGTIYVRVGKTVKAL